MTRSIGDSGEAAIILQNAAENPFYATAIRTPEHLQAVELRDAALAWRGELEAAPTPAPPTSADGIADYLAAISAAADAQRDIDQQYTALTTVANAADSHIAGAVNLLPDRVLTSLAADLANLMASATKIVAQLDGATTADQAITAGKTKPWSQLPALRADYDAIRDAQRMVLGYKWTQNQSHYLDDPIATPLVLKNIDAVMPSWLDPDTTSTTLAAAPPDPRPWPADSVQQLIWMVTSNAEIWLPTTKQFQQWIIEHRARIDNFEPKSWQQMQKKPKTDQRPPVAWQSTATASN